MPYNIFATPPTKIYNFKLPTIFLQLFLAPTGKLNELLFHRGREGGGGSVVGEGVRRMSVLLPKWIP